MEINNVTFNNEYKIHVITIPVEKMSDGRRVTEELTNQKFDNREALEKAICFNEDDPMATEDLGVYTMDSFAEACNESDDDSRPDEKIILDDIWVGYVQIKVN